MFTKRFWIATAERAVKSGAQAVALVWTMSDSGPGNLFDLDAELLIGWGLAGSLYSLITSLASGALPVGPEDSPSIVNVDDTQPRP